MHMLRIALTSIRLRLYSLRMRLSYQCLGGLIGTALIINIGIIIAINIVDLHKIMSSIMYMLGNIYVYIYCIILSDKSKSESVNSLLLSIIILTCIEYIYYRDKVSCPLHIVHYTICIIMYSLCTCIHATVITQPCREDIHVQSVSISKLLGL